MFPSSPSEPNRWPDRTEPEVGARRGSNDAGRELRRLGHVARRQGWVVVLATSLVLGAAAVATHYWPRTYTSHATFLVEQRGGTDASALALLDRFGPDNGIDTEMELLRSRRVLGRVVDELNLHVVASGGSGRTRPGDLFSDFEADRDALPGTYRILSGPSGVVVTEMESETQIEEATAGSTLSFHGIRFTVIGSEPKLAIVRVSPFEAALAEVSERVHVSRVHYKADLVQLGCEAPTALDARRLCDGVSRSYLQLRTELQRTEATAAVTSLADQATRLGKQLAAAENELEAYSRGNQVVAMSERAAFEVRNHADLTARREQLEADRSSLEGLLSGVAKGEWSTGGYRDLASLPLLIGNQAFSTLLVTLVELENQRGELSLLRSESSPEIVAVDTRIAEIHEELRSIALSHRRALASQIESLDETLETTGARLAEIPSRQLEAARLERRTVMLGDLYRLLETRLREAEVAEMVNLPSVDIVDEASLPLEPSAPSRRTNLGLGLVVGLLYGSGLALLRELRDRRVREGSQVAIETGFPILARVPRLRRPGPLLATATLMPRANGSSSPWAFPAHSAENPPSRPIGPLVLLDSNGATPQHLEVERMARPEDLVALEAFHTLAADLRLAARRMGKERFRSVAITSAGRGEGKTFTASNLALVRAAHGDRVLLVDADLRAGGASRFFAVPDGTPGLSDALSRGSNIRSEWRGLRVNRSELWLLPAGTLTPESPGLLESPNLGLLLARAESDFDVVIIDTPPLGLITDAAPIAAAVDGLIFVCREGVTDRESLHRTLERLRRSDGALLGTLLNDARIPRRSVNQYEDYHRPTATPKRRSA